MKLIITDFGDPSVGIFSSTYEIPCPFDDDADIDALVFFKDEIKKIYSEYADGKIVAEYDRDKFRDLRK
jgi:hypothetical protein